MSYITQDINRKTIRYRIEKGAIHLNNDSELNALLRDESKASLTVAEKMLESYSNEFGSFDASAGSIALEILCHVYPDRIGKKLLKIPMPSWAKNQIEKLLTHTDVIDIGENDTERGALNIAGKFIDWFF